MYRILLAKNLFKIESNKLLAFHFFQKNLITHTRLRFSLLGQVKSILPTNMQNKFTARLNLTIVFMTKGNLGCTSLKHLTSLAS